MATEEFTLQEEFEREFNAYPPLGEVKKSPSILEMSALVTAAQQGFDADFARRELERMGPSFLEAESRSRAISIINEDFNREVNDAIEVQDLPAIQEADKKNKDKLLFAELTENPAEYALARDQGGSLFDHIDARTISRYATMRELIDERIQSEDVGVGSVIFDIVDLLVSAPIDALRRGGFARTDLAMKVHGLMTADIPEDEFRRRARESLDEIADSGILTDSNFLFLLSGAQNMEELGEGTEATLDKFATIADLISLGGFAATKSLRGLSVARNATGYLSAIAGPRAGAKVLRDGVSKPGTIAATEAGVIEETTPAYARLPRSFGKEQSWVAPGAHVAAEAETQNKFLDIIRSLKYSDRIDPKVLNEWEPQGIKNLAERIDAEVRDRVFDLAIDVDERGNIFGRVRFGRKDGMPFGFGKADSTRGRGTAEKVARQIGGEVKPIYLGGREYYLVDKIHNMSGAGLARTLENDEIGTSFMRSFGGTFLTIPARLDALAKRGEGVAQIGLKRISREFKKALKPVSKDEKFLVEKIFFDMRDGSLSHRRHPLNLQEFREEWARYSTTPPSAAAENLYQNIQEFNDALYFLKADDEFKLLNDNGFNEVVKFEFARRDGSVDKFELVAKRIDPDEATDNVINPITGEQWAAGEVPRGKKVFELNNGYKVGDRVAKFVAFDEPQTRRLFHSDVLGYNPGGPRGYDFLNHTVKQENSVKLLSGREVAARPKTIMGTATRQEALTAMTEINNIFNRIKELVPDIARQPLSKAISAVEDLDLEDVITLNNSWNTNLETTGHLADWLRRSQIHPGRPVGTAPMDAPLEVPDEAGQLWISSARTNRDSLDFELNAPKNSRRRDKPLMGFGGIEANTRSPIDMIQNDFFRVMHADSMSAYAKQSIDGWLKGAKPYLVNREDIAKMRPLEAFNNASFRKTPGQKISKEAENYEAARNAIRRTLGTRSESEAKFENLMERVAEFVWDKGFKTIDPQTGKPAPGRMIKALQASTRPLEFLRGWSFDARLGLLSPDQFFVQSSQAFNILAIIGRPGLWLESVATHWPLRLSIQQINNHGWDQALPTIRELGRRSAAFTGFSEDEFVDFTRFVWESGRLEVGGEVAELSQTTAPLARSMFSKARMGARFFFNEGEKMPRSAAMRAAWQEYVEKFPKSSPFSNHGVNWITRRQDALTAAMTRRSAAAWQQGLLSIPMQFMSYISRMLESIFTNRLLTGAERRRLAGAQMVFWGAAGTGFGTIIDSYMLENGWELDSKAYTIFRYGILDTIIQSVGDTEAVIGGRLAAAEGLSDLIRNVKDGNFIEVTAGPAGALIADMGLALWDGLYDAQSGNLSMVEYDIKKALRYISTYDDFTRAYLIWREGVYQSRNGEKVVDGLTNTDAILTIIGAQMEDVNLQFDTMMLMSKQRKAISDVTDRVKAIIREHNQAIEDGNLEQARELQKLIAWHVQKIPTWALERFHRDLARDWGTMQERVASEVIKRGIGTLNRVTEEEEE